MNEIMEKMEEFEIKIAEAQRNGNLQEKKAFD
jgi:hypothetical protein